jgi:hypothetical protein
MRCHRSRARASTGSSPPDHDLKADPTQVQSLLIIRGAPDIKAITPFWFETMEEPRGDGLGAIHIWPTPRATRSTSPRSATAIDGTIARSTGRSTEGSDHEYVRVINASDHAMVLETYPMLADSLSQRMPALCFWM